MRGAGRGKRAVANVQRTIDVFFAVRLADEPEMTRVKEHAPSEHFLEERGTEGIVYPRRRVREP